MSKNEKRGGSGGGGEEKKGERQEGRERGRERERRGEERAGDINREGEREVISREREHPRLLESRMVFGFGFTCKVETTGTQLSGHPRRISTSPSSRISTSQPATSCCRCRLCRSTGCIIINLYFPMYLGILKWVYLEKPF